MPDQKPMWTRWLGGFSVMWVTKLLISQVKKRIFCPKLAFLVNFGQAMQAYSVPCCWVSWWLWRAGCISQDTYLLYFCNFQFSDDLKMAKWCEVGKKRNSRDTWKPTKGHKSDWLMGRLLTNNPDLFSLTGFSFWNNHIEPQGWDKGQDRWRKSKLCLDIFYMNNTDIHVGPERTFLNSSRARTNK